MAASNYMTEGDTESIWDTTLDTTRFGKIGVRMAEILNFRIYRDATNQCTNAACTPIFEQISEECLVELIAAAKENAVTKPWDFIQARVSAFMMRKMREWEEFLDTIQDVESQRHHINYSNTLELPSHSDS